MVFKPLLIMLSGCALTLVCMSPAYAVLGFHLGAGVGLWSEYPEGVVHDTGNGQKASNVDLKSDFGLNGSNQGYVWVDFQQPIPFLPNLEIRHSRIDTSGSSFLSNSISYGGQTFSANQQVAGHLSLIQTDYIFYYQPLDNIIQFRWGLDVKALHLEAGLSSDTQSAEAQGSALVPMAFAGLGVVIPFTGLSVQLDGSYLGDFKNKISDYRAQLAYESAIGFGLEAGYRDESLKVDAATNNPSGSIEFKGAFAGVFYRF